MCELHNVICRDVVVAVLSLKAFDQGSGTPRTLFGSLNQVSGAECIRGSQEGGGVVSSHPGKGVRGRGKTFL